MHAGFRKYILRHQFSLISRTGYTSGNERKNFRHVFIGNLRPGSPLRNPASWNGNKRNPPVGHSAGRVCDERDTAIRDTSCRNDGEQDSSLRNTTLGGYGDTPLGHSTVRHTTYGIVTHKKPS